MEKFFIKDSPNVVPSKILNRGKSFNFSEWQSGTIYENTDYKQDFVTYGGQLWGCLETNTNTPPSLDCKEWSLLLTANSVYKFYWKLFGDNEVKPLSFNRMAKLPEKFVPGEIYYIDELQTVVIGTSETECIQYNASLEIRKQLDENVPFENGSIKNSAVLKGGYNQISNEHEVAIGKYNKSDSEDIIYSVGIGTSDVRKNAHEILQNGKHYILGIGGYDGTNTNDANDLSEEINRIISNTNKIDDLKNAIIDNEKVVAKAFSDHQSKILKNSSDIEQVPFKKGTGNNTAILKGTSNSATNKFATAFGEQTTASADRAFSEGLKTTASGANSHAEGLSTLAQGQNAHAEGNKCQAIGNHSHAEGNGTIANGGASHAEGSGTITTNNFEHAEGRYNASTKNKTIHSVGIGTSNTDRKNAHEITTDGKHYIYGIGGYDGTNILDLDGETVTARDLATVINNKVEWSNIPQSDWNQNDTDANDYIKNRTHYKNDVTYNPNDISWNNYVGTIKLNGVGEIFIELYDENNGDIKNCILNLKNDYHNSINTSEDLVYFNYDITTLILTISSQNGFNTFSIINITQKLIIQLDEQYIPDTIARKSDNPAPIIINYNTIKDAANSEVNTISEQTWLTYIANDTYKNYDWIIQRDGIKYNCTVIPDYDNEHIQILYFTRNEIEGTSGPLGNAIMKYSGLRIQLSPYTQNTYLIYKISNGGSLETREFVFGENTNKNAYLLAAAQMSKIDTIDCKWVYTDTNGRIINVDAIFTASNNSLAYIDGKGTLNTILFNNDGSYEKNSLNLLDRIYELENIISQITG